jgi:uncharacterized protein (DUF1697 family)
MGADTAPRLRYIALLRGVNVGRAKRIAMADLRKLVEDLGYTGVRSLLNSGNIVFDAVVPPVDAAQEIEAAMALHLGVSARVFVFASDKVAEIVDDNPLLHVATDHARLFVFLLAGEPQRVGGRLVRPGLGAREHGAWTSRCLCLVSARLARQRSCGSARQTAG